MKTFPFIQYPAAALLAAALPLMAVSCSSTTSATAPSSSATIGLDPYEREVAVKQAPLSDDPASPLHNMRAADNKVGLQIAEF